MYRQRDRVCRTSFQAKRNIPQDIPNSGPKNGKAVVPIAMARIEPARTVVLKQMVIGMLERDETYPSGFDPGHCVKKHSERLADPGAGRLISGKHKLIERNAT
ncbi:MAG TPA: hypothetical protein VK979_03955 [Guyparkeria sp.]|nr:hypothetical protein [Guyparkeria sp.]